MGVSELQSLKTVLVSNNRYAAWCAIAVFLGLLIEYTILLWPKWKQLSGLERVFTVLAGIAIAGGVFGEYHFGSKASDAAVKLEGISERQVAQLNNDAQKFRDQADALELQMSDRHITLDQRKNMLGILGPQRGAKIAIGYVTDSGADSLKYSLELADVFCDAKWVVFRPIELISTERPFHGFLLDSMMDSEINKALTDLVGKALKVTGYHVSVQKPNLGFAMGGQAESCKGGRVKLPNFWNVTPIEILVGSK